MGTQVPSTLKELIKWKPFYFAAGFVSVVWLINLAVYIFWPSGEIDSRGIFGDIFGASNSLFSALAFAGLIIAILLQRAELEHQRNELRMTRIEMEGQKEQLGLQKDQMEIQNFENRFFQMVGLWNHLLADIEDMQKNKGRNALGHMVMSCFESYTVECKDSQQSERDAISKALEKLYGREGSNIPSYMHMLCGIMTLVDRANLPANEKGFYTSILRSQLSQEELIFLLYYGLSDESPQDLKRLVEQYGMLRCLKDFTVVPTPLRGSYNDSAFE